MSRKRADKLTRRERKALSARGPLAPPSSRPMASLIRRLLLEWCERLDAQDAGTVKYSDEDYEVLLDRRLMGAALFVKEMASRCDELELLGLATKIEMRLADRFDKEWKAEQAYQQSQVNDYRRGEEKREQCRLHLLGIPASTVDVSRYHELITAAKIEDREVLFGLYKYLDEKRILKSVKAAVISTFVYARREVDPDALKREFDRELADFYRRADKTVADRIAKALRNEGRSEPAGPRLPAPKFFVPEDAEDDEG